MKERGRKVEYVGGMKIGKLENSKKNPKIPTKIHSKQRGLKISRRAVFLSKLVLPVVGK